MLHPLIGSGHLCQVEPCRTVLLPGLRPLRVRIDLSCGLASPSTDGGVEEFCEFRPACRFSSATSAFNSAI